MTDSFIAAPEGAHYRRINRRLFTFHAGGSLVAAFVLPFLVRFGSPLWLWPLLPLGLIANGYWATLHEAVHGQLFPAAEENRRAGRTLAILWGSSFRLLRFGHLMHHRFNRHKLDRPDSFDPATTGPAMARLRFFAEALGGLYVIEVLTPLLYLLPRRQVARIVRALYSGDEAPMPRLRQLAEQTLAGAKGFAEIRQDALLAAGFIAAALVAWGSYWPAFAAFLLGRGLLVSFLDNVYHFRTPLDRVDYAYNLSLPAPLQLLFLNMNMHRVHHRRMQLPWWQLPRQFALDREQFDDSLPRAALRQLRGPAAVAPPQQMAEAAPLS
ncbi:fatty acid desaturase [Dongia sp.]|uniref:fatty acid desaturase family protein n=1 Tax=Dongia sp. TaxID=1977262 RepID=UPI0035B2C27C